MPPKRGNVPGSRRSFPDLTASIVGMVVLDAALLAGEWVTGSPLRSGLILLAIDAVWLLVWLLVRRSWTGSPY
jgi:hypothetical protein